MTESFADDHFLKVFCLFMESLLFLLGGLDQTASKYVFMFLQGKVAHTADLTDPEKVSQRAASLKQAMWQKHKDTFGKVLGILLITLFYSKLNSFPPSAWVVRCTLVHNLNSNNT